MEILEDDPVPPLVGVARGGSRILELQAKCPFRAYAELRLASRPLQEPAAGVDARVRGIVLHRTLELLWQELGRRSALDEMHAEELTARIDAALDRAIAEVLPPELGPCAAGLEREWQRLAIVAALDLDRSRADFEVVATEGSLEATLAGLSLNLRVDRIDKVGDRRVVLDYKTGRAATSQWRGSRPDSPQLPLYAVLGGQTVGGVAFVAVGAGTAACKGVGAVEQLLPGMEPAERYRLTDDQQTGFAWDEVLQHWAGWLTQLAEDHRDGIAVVDPKLPGTCRFCHLQTLCRVAPGYETQDGDQDGD